MTEIIHLYSQCQAAGQPCFVCTQPIQRLLPIGNSLPHQAKEMFNRNEETLKKLQFRLSFQQHQLNTFLEVLARKASVIKNRITSMSKHLAEQTRELNSVNQNIENKGLGLKKLEETVEVMKPKQDGAGVGPLQQWPRAHPSHFEDMRGAPPKFKLF